MNTKTILVVDEEQEARVRIASFLRKNGLTIRIATCANEAEQIVLTEKIDLMLVDNNFSDEDSIAFCQNISKSFKNPIIICSSIACSIEQALAYESGVANYLLKPANERLLLAIIKSKLAEKNERASNVNVAKKEKCAYHFSGWELRTYNNQLVSPDGDLILLSMSEYRLLLTFVHHPNTVLSTHRLLSCTKGTCDEVSEKSIKITVCRLRKKVEKKQMTPQIIQTVRGEGYLFKAQVTKS